MKKPANFKGKLLCLMLSGGLFGLWYHFRLPCVPRTLTGIPCITCGLTRAWLYALHLDFLSALRQYPMFWAVPILALFFLWDGKLFRRRGVNVWVLGILLAGMLLSYLLRLFGFHGVLLPL